MENIKKAVKNSIFYPFLHRLYWKADAFMHWLLKTKAEEIRWSRRKSEGYWATRNDSRRKLLIDEIATLQPLKSILEVGCNTGPNLYLIAKNNPETKIYGVDINKRTINAGKKIFKDEKINNILLSVGKADNLSGFKDKSIDLVFTDAVLIYIGPDKIKKVLLEMMRVARRTIILIERHDDTLKENDRLGIYDQGYYRRNYLSLLSEFISVDKIKTIKIPYGVWPDTYWRKYGYLIEIKLKNNDDSYD